MTTNGTQAYRVDQLEKNYDKMDCKLDLIMTNHLPHIQEKITQLGTQIKVFTALNIAAVILGIIISKILI